MNKVRTTFYIDEDLYEKAKKAADKDNSSFSRWVSQLIIKEVKGGSLPGHKKEEVRLNN